MGTPGAEFISGVQGRDDLAQVISSLSSAPSREGRLRQTISLLTAIAVIPGLQAESLHGQQV